MATFTGASPSAHMPVEHRRQGVRPEWARCTRSDGPDLLTEAAMTLPAVVGRGQVRWVDIHAAIYRAACTRGMGRDRPHRLRLVDEALDMFSDSRFRFSDSLFRAGLARSGSRAAGGWPACSDLVDAQLALAAAAGQHRRELATEAVPAARTP